MQEPEPEIVAKNDSEELGIAEVQARFSAQLFIPLSGLRVSPVRLTRQVKTAHCGYEGGTAVSGR